MMARTFPNYLTIFIILCTSLCDGVVVTDNITTTGSRSDFYFNTSSSYLSFGSSQCLFCMTRLNVSLVNKMNASIIIDKYSVNDTQFRISNNHLHTVLHHNSSINLSIRFRPIARGKFWSHLSVHSDHGVLYLYLYGVGSENKYSMKPIYVNNDNHTLYPLTVHNPFNDSTLIVHNISFETHLNGLYLTQNNDIHQEHAIEAQQQSQITWISYDNQHVSLSPSPSPKYTSSNLKKNKEALKSKKMKKCEYLNDIMLDTNHDTLSIPIHFGACLKPKSSRKKYNKVAKFYFPPIDFAILTRPNMTIAKKIKFRNSGTRSVIVTNLALNGDIHEDKYVRIESNFNRSYLVLPSKMVDLGRAIFIAIPNRNRNNKPIKTNHQINVSLSVEFIETTTYFNPNIEIKNDCDFDCGCSHWPENDENISENIIFNNQNLLQMQQQSTECIDNEHHYNTLSIANTLNKKHRLSTSISGWILLGNLNYSFQQSLFYPKAAWNESSKQRHYVPMIREMTMQNNFLIPLKLQSLCIFNCIQTDEIQNYGQMDFQIVEFYHNKRIIDGQNSTICKLKYEPKSNKSSYETQLILNTNITSFQIPITIYHGHLNIMYANMTNDRNKKIDIDESEEKYWTDDGLHAGPVQIVIDFGDIPMNGKSITTLELRNGNPVHLTINPVNQYMHADDEIFDDSYDALFAGNDTISLFLYQRQSDMSVKSIHTINKYEYAYLAIGISPNYNITEGEHVLHAFINVTANNSDQNAISHPEFMMQYEDEWMSTAISSYLLRVRVMFRVSEGSFDMKPNPLWFDDSFPGKQRRSTTLTMYNYYDIDIQIDTKQSYLMHSMFSAKYAIAKSKRKSSSLLTIGAHSAKDIAKIYFNPHTKYTKYGNYVYINSTETFLLSHFDLLSAPKHLQMKYRVFKALIQKIDENDVDFHSLHEVDFDAKGINFRELFLEQYRAFLWQKILSSNDNIAQTVAHFYSPNIGKIPFIISGSLIMPHFIVDEKEYDFGQIMVGESSSLNIFVQNPFNCSVQIALIEAIDSEEAIFLPSCNSSHSAILAPYSVAILGPLEFRPKEPRSYHQMLYLRNNITMIESFNVSGVGQQGKLNIYAIDDEDDEEEEDHYYDIVADDDEEEEEYELIEFDDDELDIIYPLQKVDRAYLPKMVDFKVIKEVLNVEHDKINNLKHDKHHHSARIKDENSGGYIYHIPRSHETHDESAFNFWNYFESKTIVNESMDDSDDNDDDAIEIDFNSHVSEYGLYEKAGSHSNSFDFMDVEHRQMFMNKVNSGHSLRLRKKFRVRNEGNIVITLEGMTIISSSSAFRRNDSLFRGDSSACIYDVDMFERRYDSNKKVDAQIKNNKSTRSSSRRSSYKRNKYHKQKGKKQKKTKYKKWITNWISFVKKWITRKWNETYNNYNDNKTIANETANNESANHKEENIYAQSYYLEQRGMNYVDYNDSYVDNLWSLNAENASGFSVIGCEMFPLQLKPGEYRDFVLLFNYNLSYRSLSAYLLIKTYHMELATAKNGKNESHDSRTLWYFGASTRFHVNDDALFNLISALKPLEKGKKFILIHSFRLIVFLCSLMMLNLTSCGIKYTFNLDVAQIVCDQINIEKWSAIIVQYLNPVYDVFKEYFFTQARKKMNEFVVNFVANIPSIRRSKKYKQIKRNCSQIWRDTNEKLCTFWQNLRDEFDIISHSNDAYFENKEEEKELKEEEEVFEEEEEEEAHPIIDAIKKMNEDKLMRHKMNETKLTHTKSSASASRNRRNKKSKACHAATENIKSSAAKHVQNNNNNKSNKHKKHKKERKKTKKVAQTQSIAIASSTKQQKKSSKQKSPSSATKSRTVLVSSTANKLKRVITSYASRAKGIKGIQHNNHHHEVNKRKPRKPPRPHSHPHHQNAHNATNSSSESHPEILNRTVIDELLVTNAKQVKPHKSESPDTIISSHSTGSISSRSVHSACSVTGISINSLYQDHHKQKSRRRRGTKPPFKKKEKEKKKVVEKEKEKEKVIEKEKACAAAPISAEAELVIPSFVAFNQEQQQTHNNINNNNNFNTIHNIWNMHGDKEEKEKEEEEDNEQNTRQLNRAAAPFVPTHAKSKYNSKGELKKSVSAAADTKSSKKKKMKKSGKTRKSDATFSSLYCDTNPFIAEMAKAINGNEGIENKNYHYHIPDGILSPQTNTNNSDDDDDDGGNKDYYRRIVRDYPFNYSLTPSPKQKASVINGGNALNGGDDGINIDLESLGYNISPNRPRANIDLAAQELEIGIQESLNSLINETRRSRSSRSSITSNQLFDTPPNIQLSQKKNTTKSIIVQEDHDDDDEILNNNNNKSSIRLSQLF